MHVLHAQSQRFNRPMPEIKPGFTVRVHERIQEGNKERVQVFEGMVISTHKGHVPTDASFTVRKVVSGIGVEKVFPVLSPVIEKVEVKKVGKVRRAKLFFLRGRSGKAARMSERMTTENEYAATMDGPVAEEAAADEEANVVAQDAPESAPEVVEEAPAAAEPTTDAPKEEEQPSA